MAARVVVAERQPEAVIVPRRERAADGAAAAIAI